MMKTGNQMLKMGKSANHNDHQIKKLMFFPTNRKTDLKKANYKTGIDRKSQCPNGFQMNFISMDVDVHATLYIAPC